MRFKIQIVDINIENINDGSMHQKIIIFKIQIPDTQNQIFIIIYK
jgi:hypothetical protein